MAEGIAQTGAHITPLTTPHIRQDTVIAVSCGDPSGIGPDILLSAFAERQSRMVPPIVVFGDPEQLTLRAARLGLDCPIRVVTEGDDAASLFPEMLPVIPLSHRLTETPGQPSQDNAAGVIEAIDRATAMVTDGHARALVTAPIAKSVLYGAGFRFPGHTEYLAALAERATGEAVTPVMMIAGPQLRTVPVTIHMSLADAIATLTTDAIVQTAMIVAHDLRQRFGLHNPRLAISGLNPHAGEDGTMGREDIDIIMPAIERLKASGIAVTGPLPADTMFHAAARSGYDAAICMYHDQALIPAKTLAFDDGVNITLGLPFVRTSPDHGTAFSIAGSGTARPDSFIAALTMADRMTATS